MKIIFIINSRFNIAQKTRMSRKACKVSPLLFITKFIVTSLVHRLLLSAKLLDCTLCKYEACKYEDVFFIF